MPNKLVRDRIPEIIRRDGKNPVTHIAEDEEYWKRLKGKLNEEVKEFCEENNENEFVDILEVLYAIGDFKGWNKEELEKLRKSKAEKRGGFKDKIILEKIGDS